MKSTTLLYIRSFLPVLGVMILGFIIELTSESQVFMPSFPVNLYLLLVFSGYIIVTYLLFHKSPIMKWITSIPVTISVITAYTILTLFMGFIAQEPQNNMLDQLGLTQIKSSYPFLLVSLLFLMVLGYTIMKRLQQKMTLKNAAFFLNHAGLFLVIATASAGSGDLVRLSVPVHEGQRTNIAYDRNNDTYRLPFHIELTRFQIEEYPPELIVYDRVAGRPMIAPGARHPLVHTGKKGTYAHYEFEIEQYYSHAIPHEDHFISSEAFGSTHAAFIHVTNGQNHRSGWISTDNFQFEPTYLFPNQSHVVILSEPRVKAYRSVVNFYAPTGNNPESTVIEVNKPYTFNSWKVYQNSYDARYGRWSQLSILEVIKDPWLPVVYVGIFMLLLGSLYLIYAGRNTGASEDLADSGSM